MAGGWTTGTSRTGSGNGTTIGGNRGKPAFQSQAAHGQLRRIVASEIESLVGLAAGHPVYLLTFTDGQKLVIKGEMSKGISHTSIAAGSAQAGTLLMGIVSPGTISETLTPDEVKALESAPSLPPTLLQYISGPSASKYFVQKMPFVPKLTSLDFHRGNIDKNTIVQMAGELKGNKKLLESMGKVIAVDLFIGNQDRVAFNKDDGKFLVGNAGNFMFPIDSKGRLSCAVGLDTWDAGNPRVSNLYGSDINKWAKQCGKWLASDVELARCAREVVEDLNDWFGRFAVQSAFAALQVTHLQNGMQAGAGSLRKAVTATIQGGKRIPSGVMARADYLGWTKGVAAR